MRERLVMIAVVFAQLSGRWKLWRVVCTRLANHSCACYGILVPSLQIVSSRSKKSSSDEGIGLCERTFKPCTAQVIARNEIQDSAGVRDGLIDIG